MEWSFYFAWQFALLMLITATAAPLLKKKYGFMLGALFYPVIDLASNAVGIWTVIGMLTWGTMALCFTWLKPSNNLRSFLGLSVAGTLFFDFVTGPIAFPFLFGGTFFDALIGQIPFTISHVIGNVVVTLLLSPVLFSNVFLNKRVSALLARYGVYDKTALRRFS
ncbi:MAG: hypothetical protein WC607_04785 [Candidatus Micrarchaeia archaeon]